MSDDWEGFDRDQVVLRLNEAINVCGVLENEILRLTAELAKHQESEFHPDWSLLEATRESLREHQEKCKALAAEVTELRRHIEASDGLKCPQTGCNDTGGYPVQDGPESCYEEQCEFCWTVPDSVFMRRRDSDSGTQNP